MTDSRASSTARISASTENPGRLHILLANDDGIGAPGLRALAAAAVAAGHRVTVVAPETERSGASSSITVHGELELRSVDWTGVGVDQAWALSGTPADCGKVALHYLLAGDRPDVVLSGVNRGQNTGTCVLYSGTCGAAFEGSLLGIPSLAVSLGILWPDEEEVRPGMADELPLVSRHAPREEYARLVNDVQQYAFAASLAVDLAPGLVGMNLPWGTLMNLNVPASAGPDTPIEVGRMSPSYFVDQFEEVPPLTSGNRRFRNVGDKLIHAGGPEPWDDMALRRGLISLVPVYFEMTGHHLLAATEQLVRTIQEPVGT